MPAVLAGLILVPGGSTGAEAGTDQCVTPSGVQRLVFSAQKYPNIRRHFRGAVRRGWPRRLVINRRGADARRERALRDIPTREGFDRDEYPPAVGRGRGPGLERGRNPRGWKAEADQRDLLPRIAVPTLLIWGELDARSPLSVARRFEQAIPDAKLVVIPGAGPVSNLEQPVVQPRDSARPDREIGLHPCVRHFCSSSDECQAGAREPRPGFPSQVTRPN